MSLQLMGKLIDLIFGNLPAVVKVLPAHWRKGVMARLQDGNPFASIASNADLLRAFRLAWIEAALEVDKAVARATEEGERHGGSAEVRRFSELLRDQLRQLRGETFNRNLHPGKTAIDLNLSEVLFQLPGSVLDESGPFSGQALDRSFVSVLASVTNWPEHEVPDLYNRIAVDGLPFQGGASRRTFGELAFSAFAEIIKSPHRYPEAGEAFRIAMCSMSRELSLAILEGVNGIDEKIDSLFTEIRTLPNRDEELARYLERVDSMWARRWIELTSQISAVHVKLDESAILASRRYESTEAILQQLMAEVQSMGKVGLGPNQVAQETVLALARRLQPDEVLDFDRAVKALEFAVDIALQVTRQDVQKHDHSDNFVDDVMQRVAEFTLAGRLENGAASIDEALAEIERRDAEQRLISRQQRTDLLEASIRQGVLLRDADRVAGAVLALAALFNPDFPSESAEFKLRIDAFYKEGLDIGINFSLRVAIAMARIRYSSAKTPDQKGGALVSLGLALKTLGEREIDTASLIEAEAVFRKALGENCRDRVPLEWAMVQNNLGGVLSILAQREPGMARFEEALLAYRAALEEYTVDKAPQDWAMAQVNVGNILSTMGIRGRGSERLAEAIRTYQAALKVLRRELAPMDWAMTQHNLGTALKAMGERERKTKYLKESVRAFSAALEMRTREHVPLLWAMTQSNLGVTLALLGQWEGDLEYINDAVQAHRAALSVRTRENVPWGWAATLNNLGMSLSLMGIEVFNRGEAERGAELLDEAVASFRAALEVRTQESVPLDWAMTQNNLGQTLTALGLRDSTNAPLEEAVQAFLAALSEYTRERAPMDWAQVQLNLASTLMILGEREVGTVRLEAAVQAYCLAREEFDEKRFPGQFAAIKMVVTQIEEVIAQRGGRT